MRYEPPEWSLVWAWARFSRKPRCMIPFPQQKGHVDASPIMSDEEYAKLRGEWVAAGSPRTNPVKAMEAALETRGEVDLDAVQKVLEETR